MDVNETVATTYISIDDITVCARIRKESGDIAELVANIKAHGLINPITVMTLEDGGYQLIAGLRRLEASKILEQTDIRATVLSPIDADEQLMLEISENEQRKDFTLSERLEYAAKIDVVEKEKAIDRMKTNPVYTSNNENVVDSLGTGNCPYPKKGEPGERRNIVAEKAGFTSARQMSRIQRIAKLKPELLDRIDTGELTVNAAYDDLPQDVRDTFDHDQSLDAMPTGPSKRKPKGFVNTHRPVPYIEFVETELVEAPLLEEFNAIAAGSTSAEHERLMHQSLYAALFEHDKQAVIVANTRIGELRFRCTNDAMRIRTYEENHQFMSQRIKQLEDELTSRNG